MAVSKFVPVNFLNATAGKLEMLGNYFSVGAGGNDIVTDQSGYPDKINTTSNGLVGMNNIGAQSEIQRFIANQSGALRSSANGVQGIPSLQTVANTITRAGAIRGVRTFIINNIQGDLNGPHFEILPIRQLAPEELSGYEEQTIEIGFHMPVELPEFAQPPFIRFEATSRQVVPTRYGLGIQDNVERVLTAEGRAFLGYQVMAVANDFATHSQMLVTAALAGAQDMYLEQKMNPSYSMTSLPTSQYSNRGPPSAQMFKHNSAFTFILNRPGGLEKFLDWANSIASGRGISWTHFLTVEGALSNVAFTVENIDYSKRGPASVDYLNDGELAVVNRIRRKFNGISVVYEPTYEIKDNKHKRLQLLSSVMQTGIWWFSDPKEFRHDNSRSSVTTAGDLHCLNYDTEHFDVTRQKWETHLRALPCWDHSGELNTLVYNNVLAEGIDVVAKKYNFEVTDMKRFCPDQFFVRKADNSAEFEIDYMIGNQDLEYFNSDDSYRMVKDAVRYITDRVGKKREREIRSLVQILKDNADVQPDMDGNVEGFITAVVWASIPEGQHIQANPIRKIKHLRLPQLIQLHNDNGGVVDGVHAYERFVSGEAKTLCKVKMHNWTVSTGGHNISKPVISCPSSLNAWKGFIQRWARKLGANGADERDLMGELKALIRDKYDNMNSTARNTSDNYWINNFCLGSRRNEARNPDVLDSRTMIDIFCSLASGYFLIESGENTAILFNIASYIESALNGNNLSEGVLKAINAFWLDPTADTKNDVFQSVVLQQGEGEAGRTYHATQENVVGETFVIWSAPDSTKFRGKLPLSLMQTGGNRMLAFGLSDADYRKMINEQTQSDMFSHYVWMDKAVIGGLLGQNNLGMSAGDHNLRVPKMIDSYIRNSPALFPMAMAAIGAPDFALFATPEDMEKVKISVFKPFSGRNIVLPGFSTMHSLSSIKMQLQSNSSGWDNHLTGEYTKLVSNALNETRQFSRMLYDIFSPTVDSHSSMSLKPGIAWDPASYLPKHMYTDSEKNVDPTSLFEHVSISMARQTIGIVHPFNHHNLGSFGEMGDGFDCTLRFQSSYNPHYSGLVVGAIVTDDLVAGHQNENPQIYAPSGNGESLVSYFSEIMRGQREDMIPPLMNLTTNTTSNGIFETPNWNLNNINVVFGYQVAQHMLNPPHELFFTQWLQGRTSENPGGIPAIYPNNTRNIQLPINVASMQGTSLLSFGAKGDNNELIKLIDFLHEAFDLAKQRNVQLDTSMSQNAFERKVQVTAKFMNSIFERVADDSDSLGARIQHYRSNRNEMEDLYDDCDRSTPAISSQANIASTSYNTGVSNWDNYYQLVEQSISGSRAQFNWLESPEWPVLDTGLCLGLKYWLDFQREAQYLNRNVTMAASILRPRDLSTGEFLGVPKIMSSSAGSQDILNERMIKEIQNLEAKPSTFYHIHVHYRALSMYTKHVNPKHQLATDFDMYTPNRFFMQRMDLFQDWLDRAVAFACFSARWNAQTLINIYRAGIFVPIGIIIANPFVCVETAGGILAAGGLELGEIGIGLSIESFAQDNLKYLVGNYTVWQAPFIRYPERVLVCNHIAAGRLIWGFQPQVIYWIRGVRPNPDGENDWDPTFQNIMQNRASRFVFYVGASRVEDDFGQYINYRGTHLVPEAGLIAGLPIPDTYIPRVGKNRQGYDSAMMMQEFYGFNRLYRVEASQHIKSPGSMAEINHNPPTTTGYFSPYLQRGSQWLVNEYGQKEQIRIGTGPFSLFGEGEGSVLHGAPSAFDKRK